MYIQVSLAEDVSLEELARGPLEGFSGAEISSLCREACLLAIQEDPEHAALLHARHLSKVMSSFISSTRFGSVIPSVFLLRVQGCAVGVCSGTQALESVQPRTSPSLLQHYKDFQIGRSLHKGGGAGGGVVEG